MRRNVQEYCFYSAELLFTHSLLFLLALVTFIVLSCDSCGASRTKSDFLIFLMCLKAVSWLAVMHVSINHMRGMQAPLWNTYFLLQNLLPLMQCRASSPHLNQNWDCFLFSLNTLGNSPVLKSTRIPSALHSWQTGNAEVPVSHQWAEIYICEA